MPPGTNELLQALLTRVEEAVDAQSPLSRVRLSGFPERAEFRFSGGCRWSVRVNVRNTQARGRGSRKFYDATGNGENPELAVASFVERLPFVVQVTSR